MCFFLKNGIGERKKLLFFILENHCIREKVVIKCEKKFAGIEKSRIFANVKQQRRRSSVGRAED